ncbi:MAG: M24 family metallopeptidase [Clostridiales bacterium]|nr:M24 family metallopeptidase [Clostridiales bacterium]
MRETFLQEAQFIAEILKKAPKFDKFARIEKEEFQARHKKVYEALKAAGFEAGIVYSDEHYCGDVPYLGGNTNISIEPVAGIIGKTGFHLLAGLEGGYIAEQMAPRAGVKVHKVEMLKLADEEYPVEVETLDQVFVEACGKMPKRVAILTPREVLPVGMYEVFKHCLGEDASLEDGQEIYYKIKYIKSPAEQKLTEQASEIADLMVEAMLGVLKPGMLETEVAAWGYYVGYELGCEDMGFDIMVTANEANRTVIGKALNRPIQKGDYVHIGVAPKVDGLTACERCTVFAVDDPSEITEDQKYWLSLVEGAYKTGLQAYIDVAASGGPAKAQEQALVDYFAEKEAEVCERIGKKINFVNQKPYTGTHNTGYTECQEFFGAITLNSDEPMGENILMMLDVACRGIGSFWNDIVIPGFDYALVEKTLSKTGKEVKVLNKLPINLQHLVGKAYK